MIKHKLAYHLSKVLPLNKDITIKLPNKLRFVLRSRTMDRSVLKEVWVKEIYNKHGITVQEGDTVIDIGGHIGIFSLYASLKSKTGKVFVFEPFIENYNRVVRHIEMNGIKNVTAFNQGVGEITGEKMLFLSPDKNTGGHSLHLKNESTRTVKIQLIQLRQFCEEHQIDRINFLKLDCEGAEFDIVFSDPTILNKVDRIIMECHPYGENTCDKMVELLESSGFKVTRESNHIGGIEMLYCRR